ncbi:deoxycytidine triphosphate deaminase [Candidatus Saccharibacteria bacterium]|jgi:dCTP deaminase|nr:deoxycytidine triphosphate deaminase [Candidatus Saccharibacteria bacterium]
MSEFEKFSSPNGVYSDTEITAALESGHIVCDPPPAKINGSSIDVTLGHYFYHAGNGRESGIFNPFDKDDVDRYFGDYMEAKPWSDVRKKIADKAVRDIEYLEGIPEDHPVIMLRPNERILAHTNEFIGIKPPGTSSMQARSTTGRMGISACYCAGWGDPGYINRWTMEVHNLNEKEHVPLPVGFRLAQIVFSSTGPVGTEYAKATGNYQASTSAGLESIKANWHPSQMLPRAYTNEISIPKKPDGLPEGLK